MCEANAYLVRKERKIGFGGYLHPPAEEEELLPPEYLGEQKESKPD